jgi:hypothetical protein
VALESLEFIDRLDALIAHARPVPLTDQVRVGASEVRTLARGLRTALAADPAKAGPACG